MDFGLYSSHRFQRFVKKGSIIAIVLVLIIVPGVIYAISPYFTESTIDEEFPVPRVSNDNNDDMMMDEEMMMDDEKMMGEEMMMDDKMENSVDETIKKVEEMKNTDIDTMIDSEISEMKGELDQMMEEMVETYEARGENEDGTMMEVMGDIDDLSDEITDMMNGNESEAVEPEMTDDMVSSEQTKQDNGIILQGMGTFVGVGDGIHDASGTASIYELGSDQTVLRLEDFYSTNGPDLKVYLSTSKSASDYVSLGDLKANRGNQNYDIPDDIDLQKYDNVLIWCEPFRVLFGSAEIIPSS